MHQLERFHSAPSSAPNSLQVPSSLQVQVSSGSPLASSGESRDVSQKRVRQILSGCSEFWKS